MASKYYYFWLIIRTILLLFNVFLTGSVYVLIGNRDLLFLPIILSLILIFQVLDLIKFINRSNKEIARFVSNISYNDLSEKFDEKSVGTPFKNLYRSLNKVISDLDRARLEKEAQLKYLQMIIGHIRTGIIAIKDEDEIELINQTARELLGIKDQKRWSELQSNNNNLVPEIDGIKGKGNKLLEVSVNTEPRQLSINVSSVVIMGSSFKIITIQDIRSELEQKEIEAWHKLIQVLRHEIRNSVTPITSMTETIVMLLENQMGQAKKPSEFSQQDVEDMHSSIQTVHERSEHLYQFVEKYRQLTKIPPPVKEMINPVVLLSRMTGLFRNELKEKGIQITNVKPDNSLHIHADPSLVEQVLINLIKNSIFAVQKSKDPMIRLSVNEAIYYVNILVEDNGIGIEHEMIQDIFLPFFTTRQDGMGIGLSLSRQIMNLHGGYLTAESEPRIKTVFTMAFPK